MESQPQNPEFRNNPENFHQCTLNMHVQLANGDRGLNFGLSLHHFPYFVWQRRF